MAIIDLNGRHGPAGRHSCNFWVAIALMIGIQCGLLWSWSSIVNLRSELSMERPSFDLLHLGKTPSPKNATVPLRDEMLDRFRRQERALAELAGNVTAQQGAMLALAARLDARGAELVKAEKRLSAALTAGLFRGGSASGGSEDGPLMEEEEAAAAAAGAKARAALKCNRQQDVGRKGTLVWSPEPRRWIVPSHPPLSPSVRDLRCYEQQHMGGVGAVGRCAAEGLSSLMSRCT